MNRWSVEPVTVISLLSTRCDTTITYSDHLIHVLPQYKIWKCNDWQKLQFEQKHDSWPESKILRIYQKFHFDSKISCKPSATVLMLINGMSAIFQQGLKQVLCKHYNFIASSLEVVGCGSNEPAVHFDPQWLILPVMIKAAQNLHSHDKTVSPECVMPFRRAPPRKTRSANNKRRKCAILTD